MCPYERKGANIMKLEVITKILRTLERQGYFIIKWTCDFSSHWVSGTWAPSQKFWISPLSTSLSHLSFSLSFSLALSRTFSLFPSPTHHHHLQKFPTKSTNNHHHHAYLVPMNPFVSSVSRKRNQILEIMRFNKLSSLAVIQTISKQILNSKQV